MTEAEWLACTDSNAMRDALLSVPGSERKYRLYAVACSRRLEAILSPEATQALDVAERFADGLVGPEALAAVYAPEHNGYYSDRDSACYAAEPSAAYAADLASDHVADYLAQPGPADPLNEEAVAEELARQCALLRDIFGNPFQPATFNPSWRTLAAVAVARSMYDERRFDDMSVLGDALVEAGCSDNAILGHCRDPKQVHVRGCWVVDLVLGLS